MEITKFKKEDFKKETLKTPIYDFEFEYLSALATKITNTEYSLSATEGLCNHHIRFETNCFDLEFFIDFINKNKIFVEKNRLMDLEYDIIRTIENRVSYAMSSFRLKAGEKAFLENFGATGGKGDVMDRRYTYKNKGFKRVIKEDTELDKAVKVIEELEKIKDEAVDLFNRYYNK